MKTDSSPTFWQRIKPQTRLGTWAAILGAGYFVLMPLWRFFDGLGAWPAFLSGLAGGVCGLIAIFRQRERSWLVYLLALIPLLLVLFFFVGEFFGPPH
jgi:hypothetical protein